MEENKIINLIKTKGINKTFIKKKKKIVLEEFYK